MGLYSRTKRAYDEGMEKVNAQRSGPTFGDPENRTLDDYDAMTGDERSVARDAIASKGTIFDPVQDPAFQRDARANDGFNGANFWARGNTLLNRSGNDLNTRTDNATASRAAADTANTGRPTYQIPTYNAPAPWQNTGQRAPLQTDADILARYGTFAAATGADTLNREGTDYQAERVGDYGEAFNTWLTGAQSSFGKKLQQESNLLRESAAGRGRLNTGFYDEDVGKLSRQVAGDFSDAARMAALDAAGLSLKGASGNADRALEAAKLRGDRSDAAYRNNIDLLDRSLDRSSYLDKTNDARYESDRDFDYGVYGDARDFGRDTFEKDRNFGYGAFRDQNRDWESDRGFAEDRYRYDENQADDARDFYADYLNGLWDRRTQQNEAAEAKKFKIGDIIGPAISVGSKLLGVGAPAAPATSKAGTKLYSGYNPELEEDDAWWA